MRNFFESVANNFGYFEDRVVVDSSSLIDLAISVDYMNDEEEEFGDNKTKVIDLINEFLPYPDIYISRYVIDEVRKFFTKPYGKNYVDGYCLRKDVIWQLFRYIKSLPVVELNDKAESIIAETNKGREKDYKLVDKCIFMTGFVVSADTVVSQNGKDFPLIQHMIRKYYRPVLKKFSYDESEIINGLVIMRKRRNPPKNESFSKSMARKILDEIYKEGF